MSLTPEQERARALAWDRFYDLAAEVQRRHQRREGMAARRREQGPTPEDLDEVNRAMREYEQAMRQLRKAAKAFPVLLSEAGCGIQVDELRCNVNRLSAAWRDLKSSWREHDPRPPADR